MADFKTINGQKIYEYLQDFVRTDYFQNGIKEIRKKHGIPKDGYPCKEGFYSRNSLYTPEGFDMKRLLPLTRELDDFFKAKLQICTSSIVRALVFYCFHNRLERKILSSGMLDDLDAENFCAIEDEGEMIKIVEKVGGKIPKFIKDRIKKYPLAIRIQPNVSQNSLVEFIKNNWELIEFLMGQYGDMHPEVKQRKKHSEGPRRRNDLIYKNRHLPLKKIKDLLEREGLRGGLMEYEIAKIKSSENKKRK